MNHVQKILYKLLEELANLVSWLFFFLLLTFSTKNKDYKMYFCFQIYLLLKCL